MSGDPTIRRATEADAAAIERVARDAWHAAYDDELGADRVEETVDAWFDPGRLVDDDIGDPERSVFVAEIDGGVVGFAELVPDDDEDARCHLYRIYVASAHWGRGVGGALLDRAEAAARERGFERLELSVMAANERAVRFYEAHGFDRIGSTHDDAMGVQVHEYEQRL
ncbi:GNAT family N-acetyltransferase [Haloglomus litoreum]|uniref:GNAT family N-acetyltransferase n=1 Tax=Haloglomus litoreum TaxID=3034026 RepID=UPI0023E8E52E|nr:GNAT family N-acetyltransferase [Haloglomus sp. DT116]